MKLLHAIAIEAAIRNIAAAEVERLVGEEAIRKLARDELARQRERATVELEAELCEAPFAEEHARDVVRQACEFLLEQLEGDEHRELRQALSALHDHLANR